MTREPSGRQYINYSFFKFLPDWYLLTKKKKSDIWSKLKKVLKKYDKSLTLNMYSTLGYRPETDFMFWRVGDSLELFELMSLDILKTGLGPYISTPYSFLSMTKHSQYVSKNKNIDQEGTRIKIKPKKEEVFNYLSFCKKS